MIYMDEVFRRRCTESIDPILPMDILILVKIVEKKRKNKRNAGETGWKLFDKILKRKQM